MSEISRAALIDSAVDSSPQPTRRRLKRMVLTGLRLLVAVLGVAYLVTHVTVNDRVMLIDPSTGRPVTASVKGAAHEGDAAFQIVTASGARHVSRAELVASPHRRKVELAGGGASVRLLAVKPQADGSPAALLVADSDTTTPRWISPSKLARPAEVAGSYPLLEVGLTHLVRDARRPLLWLSLLVYAAALAMVTARWEDLMEALDVHVGYARAFRLILVGSFYNTFMPGSTGGDVVRAYEVSRHTRWRTRAVMSVLVDRVLGLLALVMLGGAAAAYQWFKGAASDPAVATYGRVALGSAVILIGCASGVLLFSLPVTRRLIDAVLPKLPMRKQLGNAVQALDDYRRQPGATLRALLVSLPAHGVVVLSALLAGKALGLPLPSGYYPVVVPVIVLAGVLPLAPQGVGVMEFFAVLLTHRQGATVTQALALALAIRLVPMAWSLLGAAFVLRGSPAAETETADASRLMPAVNGV